MQAGDIVFTAASLRGPNSIGSAVIHQDRPIRGIVESLVAGSPPTTVLVNWQNGTSVTYATSGTGATAVLYKLGQLTTIPLTGTVVRPKQGSGIPNPGGRLQGPVVYHLGVVDPSTDLAVTEVVVIETPIGFLVADLSQVEVVPSA